MTYIEPTPPGGPTPESPPPDQSPRPEIEPGRTPEELPPSDPGGGGPGDSRPHDT